LRDLQFWIVQSALDALHELITTTHWPSWLRGFSIAMFVWSGVTGLIDVAIMAILLYAASHWLARYYPYPSDKR
jgi:hypothetical protein